MLAEIIRLIVVLASAVGGAYLINYFTPPIIPENLALILYIIISSGIGYVAGGIIGRRLSKLIAWIEQKTQNISSSELIMGVAGLILGLVVASLIADPLYTALNPTLKIVTPYLIILVYLILGYLGFTIFMKKKPNIDLLPNVSSQQKSDISKLKVIDTSVVIDGRILDLAKSEFIEGKMVVPKFVLSELQLLADSGDDIRRARGRRGLEILNKMKKDSAINIVVTEDDYPAIQATDDKLVEYAKDKQAILITNDYNLGKIANLKGVQVYNVNELASSVRPVVLAGEEIRIKITKEGKEKNQGVGYLDDGTMVVIENGKNLVGKEKEVIVESVLATTAGKIVFSKLKSSKINNKKKKR